MPHRLRLFQIHGRNFRTPDLYRGLITRRAQDTAFIPMGITQVGADLVISVSLCIVLWAQRSAFARYALHNAMHVPC